MRKTLTALLVLLAGPAIAGEIMIEDAYARTSRPGAPTGAIFLVIHNGTDTDDRLVAVASPAAKRVELHTHIDDNGVMKMRRIEGGLPVPAGGLHELARGGDHVMLMGVTEDLTNGVSFPLTLIFEDAGEVTTTVTVDNDRGQSGHQHQHQHQHRPEN